MNVKDIPNQYIFTGDKMVTIKKLEEEIEVLEREYKELDKEIIKRFDNLMDKM